MAPDAMRFTGGPLDGLVYPAPAWPPPEEVGFALVLLAAGNVGRDVPEEGTYKRISYSDLPDEIRDKPHIFRGGQYEWVLA